MDSDAEAQLSFSGRKRASQSGRKLVSIRRMRTGSRGSMTCKDRRTRPSTAPALTQPPYLWPAGHKDEVTDGLALDCLTARLLREFHQIASVLMLPM